MSIRIKKKSKLYKLIEESPLLDVIIFGYLGGDCTNLLMLDKIIYHTVKGRIRYHINQTVKSFSHQYRTYFDIQPKQHSLKRILTQKRQLKLAIPIYFSIKKLLKQFQYSISYSYEISRKNKGDKENDKNKNKNKQFAWSCQFVVSKQKRRLIWLYKQNYSYADMSSYVMDITPVCIDDTLCILCPFYSSGHPIHNLKFYPLTVKPFDQLGSRCQIEGMYPWSDYNCKKSLDFQIEDLVKGYPLQLQTKSIKEYSLQNFYRIELQCIKQSQQLQLLDFMVRILPANQTITCELKKKGCYNDEENYLQLRCGDILIIYLIKS